MVVPYVHAASLTELEPAQRAELGELTMHCEQVLRQAMRPDGFNIGLNLGSAAGAGIAEHLHVHVVPRWDGDTNYMTVVGEIRVIPRIDLDDTAAFVNDLGFVIAHAVDLVRDLLEALLTNEHTHSFFTAHGDVSRDSCQRQSLRWPALIRKRIVGKRDRIRNRDGGILRSLSLQYDECLCDRDLMNAVFRE